MRNDNPDHLKFQNQNSCPKLGLKEDPDSYSAFPLNINACYQVRPVDIPNLSHQRSYCLTSAYLHCPVYESAPGGKMPKEISLKKETLSKDILFLLSGIGVLLVIIILFFSFRSGRPRFFAIDELSTPSPTTSVSPTITPAQPIDTATTVPITPSLTELLATDTRVPPTPTAIIVILTLDTPIGGDQNFIIHRVAEGETLQIFADKYHTSVEAIKAINFDLIIPLWTDWLVIIPVNVIDVSKLPLFEAHQVEEEYIKIQDLSTKLSASLEEMIHYNNIEENYLLRKGDWLLVPREKPQP